MKSDKENLPLIYSPLSYSIFFVNPKSRLSISTPFSLSLSILRIATYIFSISCLSPSIFYTTSSIQINSYLFLFLGQSKLFLSLVYSPLFLYYSLSIQIHVSLFRPQFLYLRLILIYPTVFIFISFLSTTITFYLLFIQIHIYRFQSPSLNLSLSLVYWPISFSIFLKIQIDRYIF